MREAADVLTVASSVGTGQCGNVQRVVEVVVVGAVEEVVAEMGVEMMVMLAVVAAAAAVVVFVVVVVVVVGCLRVAQRPPEGAKTTEIPD